MANKSLTETYLRNLMEDDRERKALEHLKKDKKFQKLLKALNTIENELEKAVQDIVKNDPELKKLTTYSGADWRDTAGFRD